MLNFSRTQQAESDKNQPRTKLVTLDFEKDSISHKLFTRGFLPAQDGGHLDA